ncbi:MAG: right-handed parallel beta-helix repeat-containing protein [Candidatus Cloacimonetes bacterium]|nr:right-handed parallel beta-helix repeat-containing protein [Candidatus Cloacimonadota bacterium]
MKEKTIFILLMILMTTALATTIYIPADYATIQEGIYASEDGDEIIVSPGTYVETINFAGKAIILGSLFYTTQDTSYISQTIIDGNQDGSVVTFDSGEDSTSVLTGFTITNGSGQGNYPHNGGGIYFYYSSPSLENVTITNNLAESGGGGIYCDASNPSLEDVTITGNVAEWGYGGGIYCIYSSSPTLANVTITGNSAEVRGGGIYCTVGSSPSLVNVIIMGNSTSATYNNFGGGMCCYDSSPSLANVTITGNSAYWAGGIYCSSSSPSLVNVTITDNSAGTFGGGICCYNNSNPSLENVTITGNSVEGSAGGIYCSSSSPILENVTITNNLAGGCGGGIYCYDSSPSLENVTITGNSASYGSGIYCYNNSIPNLENVTITDNSAEHFGGGIYCNYSSPGVENVKITDNSAEHGGGIYCYDSSPSLVNVTITDNSAEEDGGGIYCTRGSNPILVNCIFWNNLTQEVEFYDYGAPNTITIAYCDIDGGEAGIETNNNGTVNWLEGNIDADPLFVDAEMGNYLLTEDSPCIDAGTSYFEYDGEVLVDLSEDEYYGIAPDMGAYEYGLVSTDELKIENVKLKINTCPNPFNPETTISFFTTEGTGNTEISIYNLKGQKVTTLVNEQFEAGSHKVTWNASGQSSGIYLLRFITAEKRETKKLILLK